VNRLFVPESLIRKRGVTHKEENLYSFSLGRTLSPNVKGGRGKQRPYEINVKTGRKPAGTLKGRNLSGVMWDGMWVRKLGYFGDAIPINE